MLTLDGSTLEGGGQLVRVALSISAVRGIPVRITNIRAGRGSFFKKTKSKGRSNATRPDYNSASRDRRSGTGGGLKESHLAALMWLATECNARVEGGEVGSLEVVFRPQPHALYHPASTTSRQSNTSVGERASGLKGTPEQDDNIEFIELRNPGSVWLIWQAIFPYIVFSSITTDQQQRRRPSKIASETTNPLHENHAKTESPRDVAFRIRLRGGTNVPKAPSSEYMQQVFLPLCEKIGLPKVEIRVMKRGWTTGSAEVGEVDITVFHPPSLPFSTRADQEEDIKCRRGDNAGKEREDHGHNLKEHPPPARFQLPPFHLSPASDAQPSKIISITVTTITASTAIQTLLHNHLHAALRALPYPPFSTNPNLPILTHPSTSTDSGDDRRIYVLLTAHTDSGFILGRDHLAAGKKMGSETERRRIVEEVVRDVVTRLGREISRHTTTNGKGRGGWGVVDEFAEDQLVIFQALAEGKSRVGGGYLEDEGDIQKEQHDTGSLHTKTVRWVCQEMLGTVFDGAGGCDGGGLREQEEDMGLEKCLDV